MLHKLALRDVGPADTLDLDPVAARLNLITGDNGLGKSFLLEIAWWALTRSWATHMAVPSSPVARIRHAFDGAAPGDEYSEWSTDSQNWVRPPRSAPANPGVVLYAKVDGSCTVWDPLRNQRVSLREDGGKSRSPGAYYFRADDVLWGLTRTIEEHGRQRTQTLCRGLIRDWVLWERSGDPRFEVLRTLLERIGPEGEPIVPGPHHRPTLDDAEEIPTLAMPYGRNVPITYAPAGARRVCNLAYLLTWAMTEHLDEATRQGHPPSTQVVILIDELETHLHPRWQRTILPSLLDAVAALPGGTDLDAQLLVVTHSPFVLASAEPFFDVTRDALWKLDRSQAHGVRVERDQWFRRGDVSNWLTSDVFDLGAPRSKPAEDALARAASLFTQPRPDPAEIDALTATLRGLLSDTDEAWTRWSYFAKQHGRST